MAIHFPKLNPFRSLSSPSTNAPSFRPRSPSSPTTRSVPSGLQPDRFDSSARVGTGGSRWWDRHRPGTLDTSEIQTLSGRPNRPVQFTTVPNIVPTAQWNSVARQLIGELFKTEAGFDGHTKQIQNLFGQLSKATKSGVISAADAKNLLAPLTVDMQKSLGRANFNVPHTELTAPGLGTLKFGKQDGQSWAYFDDTPPARSMMG